VRGIVTEVVRERDARVFEWAMRHDLAVAWVLAGGYSSLDFPVESVARLHRITVEEAARVARDQSKSMTTPASATD
jgi:acetoin utilization deacetylase AcuC-like enzyme